LFFVLWQESLRVSIKIADDSVRLNLDKEKRKSVLWKVLLGVRVFS
jgi:hypothetical protein